jgi:hypothetical protein
MTANPSQASSVSELVERLRKRAKQEREWSANSALVAELLQPEMDKFEARTDHNIYAVHMAVDHRNDAKKGETFADDLEQAAALVEQVRVMREALENARNMIGRQGHADKAEGCPQCAVLAKIDAALNDASGAINREVG